MGYRRVVLVGLFFCCVGSYFFASSNFFAKKSLSISSLFLFHAIYTKVTKDESKTDDEYRLLVRSASDDIYKDLSLCLGSSLDLNIDIIYISFRFAFPLQINTQFLNFPSNLFVNRSIVSDFEIGLCYKTFEKKAYNLIFGLGLGFGVDHIKMAGYIEENRKISYTRSDLMLGLGGNVLFTYNFHKVVGIYFGVGDMFYFMNIKTYRLIESAFKNFIFEEKLKSENFNAINTFANSLSLKMGLLFAF